MICVGDIINSYYGQSSVHVKEYHEYCGGLATMCRVRKHSMIPFDQQSKGINDNIEKLCIRKESTLAIRAVSLLPSHWVLGSCIMRNFLDS